MTINYNVTGSERKRLADYIAGFLGCEKKYLGVPSCAYQAGYIKVSKDGAITFDDRADSEEIEALLEELENEGFHAAPATEAEKSLQETEQATQVADNNEDGENSDNISLTVSLPAAQHTGTALRNLVNLIYTRASLLNKALGTAFRVDEGLTDALLDDSAILTAEAFRNAVATYEDKHGKAIDGLTITPESITFSSLPETDDPVLIRTFTELCVLMNKQALTQKRIQAKEINEENEKYSMRIWLIRLGLNGPDHKEMRKVLMENLSGHCAFRTNADKIRWQERQAAKRDALRAGKTSVSTESIGDTGKEVEA